MRMTVPALGYLSSQLVYAIRASISCLHLGSISGQLPQAMVVVAEVGEPWMRVRVAAPKR